MCAEQDFPFCVSLDPDYTLDDSVIDLLPPQAAPLALPPSQNEPALEPASSWTARASPFSSFPSRTSSAVVTIILSIFLPLIGIGIYRRFASHSHVASSSLVPSTPPSLSSASHSTQNDSGKLSTSSNESTDVSSPSQSSAIQMKRQPRVEIVGKLSVDTRVLLGHGSHGTVVYKVQRGVESCGEA